MLSTVGPQVVQNAWTMYPIEKYITENIERRKGVLWQCHTFARATIEI